MNRKEIHFKINKNGEITTTVKGIKGGECTTNIDQLKDMGAILSEKRTPEYFEKENLKNSVYNSLGKKK